jgi:hypothetical protein
MVCIILLERHGEDDSLVSTPTAGFDSTIRFDGLESVAFMVRLHDCCIIVKI